MFDSDWILQSHDSIRKELNYVQQAHEEKFRVHLHRLVEISNEFGKARLTPFRTDLLTSGQISKTHQAVLFHSLALHIGLFSEFQINLHVHTPLWMRVAIDGSGLRAIGPDYLAHYDNVARRIGLPSAETLCARYLLSPESAYRLGQVELVKALERKGDRSHLRSQPYLKAFSDFQIQGLDVERIERLASSLKADEFISLIAFVAAQSARKSGEILQGFMPRIQEWVRDFTKLSHSHQRSRARLAAQVVNSLNLLFLRQGQRAQLDQHMQFLEGSVFPCLPEGNQKRHIVGNFLYQKSILARLDQDQKSEWRLLHEAKAQDEFFATIYCRIAQILHDENHPEAEAYYLMAIALGPFDYSTVNDFGCFLAEQQGREKDLESMTLISSVLFQEAMSKAPP